ncbi:hypothetical protein DL96DRAFT_1290100 [Flagelloscypha sp. PMI_526]|nr:hypothetical protein DL96DRAFT_1290100 [Flagelloscypha sp. PMI_526]
MPVELPGELTDLIINFIEDRKDLIAFAGVCKRWVPRCRARAFHSMKLGDDVYNDTPWKEWVSMTNRPQSTISFEYVRTLQVKVADVATARVYSANPRGGFWKELVSTCLPLLINVTELDLFAEIPVDISIVPPRFIQRLRRLVLRGQPLASPHDVMDLLFFWCRSLRELDLEELWDVPDYSVWQEYRASSSLRRINIFEKLEKLRMGKMAYHLGWINFICPMGTFWVPKIKVLSLRGLFEARFDRVVALLDAIGPTLEVLELHFQSETRGEHPNDLLQSFLNRDPLSELTQLRILKLGPFPVAPRSQSSTPYTISPLLSNLPECPLQYLQLLLEKIPMHIDDLEEVLDWDNIFLELPFHKFLEFQSVDIWTPQALDLWQEQEVLGWITGSVGSWGLNPVELRCFGNKGGLKWKF